MQIGFYDIAIWGAIISIVDIVMACSVTVHAVLWKRDIRAVISWVGVAWLVPILGSIGYICFGINRIERKGISLGLAESWRPAQPPELGLEDRQQAEQFAAELPGLVGLARAARCLTDSPILPGNEITPLRNGDQAYPQMLEAIRSAETSVAMLTYIFDSDRSGEDFFQALVAAHQRGVKVRVLVDDVGSKYSRPNMVGRLRSAGICTASFLPTAVPRLPRYANLRNHRKILVVDGEVAFTGGTNIREGHCLNLEPVYPVKCLHFRLTGPVVSQIQRAFAGDWAFASGESISGEEWFPNTRRTGEVWARGIESGPDEHFEVLTDLILAALASARTRVRIMTPYFLPSTTLIKALNVADMRGVDVQIYLPKVNNIRLVQWASYAQMWQILEKGCRVFETPPPFDHSKIMVVDDAWTLIGSTNWDPRSLRLNFEFNVECYSREFASTVNTILDEKTANAIELTADQLQNRSFTVRLRDGLARLFSPFL